jgi:hypothetical protein
VHFFNAAFPSVTNVIEATQIDGGATNKLQFACQTSWNIPASIDFCLADSGLRRRQGFHQHRPDSHR